MIVERPIFVIGSLVIACTINVPRLPVAGETLRASDFHLEVGGKGFNCSVALRRLGEQVDGLLTVGDDLFAKMARTALGREDLPSSMLLLIGRQTGAGIGLIQPDGENVIAVFPGANDALAASHVRDAENRIARATMAVGQFEIQDAPLLDGFRIARANDTMTILNPSPFRPVNPTLLQMTDALIMNATEADACAAVLAIPHHALRADTHASLARALFEHGVQMVIVTAGAEGARIWLRTGTTLDQPAFPVVARDTIGAGDAFLAGLCSALNKGSELADALRYATACGAIVASRPGVLGALPFPVDVDAMLAKAS